MRYTVLALLLGFAQTPAAPRTMKLVDLLDVPSLGDPQLSPDGREVLYVLSTADWKADRSVGHIWRATADGGGTAVQLTNAARGERAPRWSPDGRLIAFVATRDSDVAQIYLISDAGGEARQLTHHATSPGNIAWTPSGDAIFFVAEEPKTKEQRDKERQKDDVFAYDENYQQHHLWKVTLPDGVEHRITEGDYSVLDYTLSRDGSKIVQQRAPSPLLGDADKGEVWVTDAAGANAVQLTHNQVGESDAQLAPDNARVLFRAGANARFESYYNDNIFLVPAAGAQPPQVTHVFDPLARDFRLHRQEKITWKGADGVTVEGLLFYPLDYQPRRRYPLVVQTHGGPASSDRFGFAGSWGSYAPVLTAMGYAVLRPNYRGSTGYGNAFLRDMVGHYYKNAHLAVEGHRQRDDTDAHLRGAERPARADAAVGGAVSRAQVQRRADAALRRAAGAARLGGAAPPLVQNERRAGVVRALRYGPGVCV